jgi:hypothetical protein
MAARRDHHDQRGVWSERDYSSLRQTERLPFPQSLNQRELSQTPILPSSVVLRFMQRDGRAKPLVTLISLAMSRSSAIGTTSRFEAAV